MFSERKEMRIKKAILEILMPLFENNPSLVEAFDKEEITYLVYLYTDKIFEALKNDLN